MGSVIICFKTSNTLPNFPRDTKSNKELQTVIFYTEGMEFEWHVSRGTATASPASLETEPALRIRRQPEGTVATTWNYRRDKCSGGRKDAVLQRGGRSAKQMLLHETERACYAMLHQVADGFFGMMSAVESRHEIYNWEGQEALEARWVEN